MCCTKKVLVPLLSLCCFVASAQNNLDGFWQPQIAVNYTVSEAYSHNFSVAYRSFFVEEGSFDYQSRQLDFVHFSNVKIGSSESIAIGVQYRFRDFIDGGPNELRLTQQFNTTNRPMVVRFGHRVRSEQRITRIRTTHRFRYRFALDFPLQGEKLDLGEPYFVGSLENLLSVTRGRSSQYDFRINGQLGWQLDKTLKLQFGMEYRMENYTAVSPQNIVFLLTSAQLSL